MDSKDVLELKVEALLQKIEKDAREHAQKEIESRVAITELSRTVDALNEELNSRLNADDGYKSQVVQGELISEGDSE